MFKALCVYLGANSGQSSILTQLTIKLGQQLAKQDIRLIYGGSSCGLMGVLARTVIADGGEAIGIIPKCLLEKEQPLTNLTQLVITETMQERKLLLQQHADAFLVFPGGLGTLEEALETWNAVKIGVGFFNLNGYYDGLFTFMKHCEKEGFITSTQRNIPLIDTDLNALLNALIQTKFEKMEILA